MPRRLGDRKCFPIQGNSEHSGPMFVNHYLPNGTLPYSVVRCDVCRGIDDDGWPSYTIYDYYLPVYDRLVVEIEIAFHVAVALW